MANKYVIAVLEGDGIGPEIMAEAVKVIEAVSALSGAEFELHPAPFGGKAYFDTGHAFPEETIKVCDKADAILKGPIGLSFEESKKIPVDQQPERGALLPLRKRYDTYANFRPVYLPPELAHFSPLKPSVIEGGVDIMMIRELVGGLYFGAKETGKTDGVRWVKETLEYDENQIRRILKVAFEQARKRKKVLHNIHKSNVLKSSVLWNDILEEVRNESYEDIEVKHVIVDAAATALVLNPRQFDVMVMENMFGDILSDLGGGILGSLGLMPSACIGEKVSYYEPSHGSAPDIAGKGIANPYSMIGSVALMLEKSFGMDKEATQIWEALRGVFDDGFTTADLGDPEGKREHVSTRDFGDKVVEKLRS